MRMFQWLPRWSPARRVVAALAGLALAGVLAGGCGPEKERAATTAPASEPRLSDVPVPAGFKFIADRSSDRLTEGFRIANHRYEGDAPLRQVAAFYKREMPRGGWQLVDESFGSGRQRYMFNKGAETCHISIWDDWGTKVYIQVLPKGGNPVEAPAAPGMPATATPGPTSP